MGLVIQQVGQIAEQLLGGTGVETLASSFADGVGSIAFCGILCEIEEFMVVLSVRILHAVYGQKGFVAARAQGYHPESFLKGGRLFVKRLVLYRHDVDAGMKFFKDFRCEMGGELYLHPYQLVLHLLQNGLFETGPQGVRKVFPAGTVEWKGLRYFQKMFAVNIHDFLVYGGHHVIVLEKGTGWFFLYGCLFMDSPFHHDCFPFYGPFRTREQEQIFIAFRKVGKIQIEGKVFKVGNGFIHRHS